MYYVVGHARLQSSGGDVSERELLTLYRSAESGAIWARPTAEFEDGRFSEMVPESPSLEPSGLPVVSAGTSGCPVVSYISQAAMDVCIERSRQVGEEGWTSAHDDAHTHGEMAVAAACYALSGSAFGSVSSRLTEKIKSAVWGLWTWDWKWWKPTSSRRDLVKAGALIIAEIERQDRIKARYSREQASASS